MTAICAFTAHDRCDRCGAQAKARATRHDQSSELLFCGYHVRQCVMMLKNEGWLVEHANPNDEALCDALAPRPAKPAAAV